MSIRNLLIKYKQLLAYMFWGSATTIVDWALYFLTRSALGEYWAVAVAWCGAVLFSFVSNKLFVFDSKSWRFPVVMPEFLKFAGARAFTLGLTEGIMWLFVEQLCVDDGIVKIGASVLTILINYVMSKLFIFGRKNDG